MTSAHTIMHIPLKGIDIPRVSYGAQRLDKHRHRQSGSLTGQASVNGFLSLWPSIRAMVKTIKTSQNPALLERKLRIHKKQVPGWKSPCTLQIRSFENMVPYGGTMKNKSSRHQLEILKMESGCPNSTAKWAVKTAWFDVISRPVLAP